jgi:hypothetical protein
MNDTFCGTRPEKIRELTFRPNWDRCLHGAAESVAQWVRTKQLSPEDLKTGEEILFKEAHGRYARELWYESTADLCHRSQDTLLYMQSVLRA